MTKAARRHKLWAALSYLIKKDFDRDQVPPGETRVSGVIHATVGRAALEESFSGTLHVAPSQSSATSMAADLPHVIAVVLGKLPESHRVRLLSEIPKDFERRGALPPVNPEDLAAVQSMLKRLRSNTIKERRGNLVFSRHED